MDVVDLSSAGAIETIGRTTPSLYLDEIVAPRVGGCLASRLRWLPVRVHSSLKPTQKVQPEST